MLPISRRAILTLLAATTCTFTGCGLNFAFGVFQDAYETEGGPFLNASPTKIDLIVHTVVLHPSATLIFFRVLLVYL